MKNHVVSLSRRLVLGLSLAVAGVSLSDSPSAHAATDTWSPTATTGTWNNAANWSDAGNTVPASGDVLVFGTSPFTALTDNLMTPATYTLGGITFNAGASAYTITSGTASTNGFTLAGNVTNNGTNLETINDLIALSGTDTITTNTGGGNITIGAVISGSGLNVAGTGMLTLSGADTYSGGTTLSSGTLNVTNATGLGTGAVTVNSGGTLTLNPGTAGSTVANGISGSGVITVQDPGAASSNTLVLSGDYGGFSGTLDILAGGSNNGKVQFTNGTQANIMSSGTVQIQSGATLYLDNALNYGFSTQLFGTGNAENLGALRIEGNANITGGVTLFANSNIGVNTGTGIISGAIGTSGGSFGFAKVGAATLVLTGSNTYTGATTISAGTLQLGSGGATGSISPSSAITDNSTFTINRSNTTTQGTDFGAIGGTGAFTQAGSGTTTLSGANTYTGATTVSAGTLNYSGTNSTSGQINVGVSGGGNAVMNVLPGANINMGSGINVFVGAGTSVSSGPGFVYQSGGTLQGGSQAAGGAGYDKLYIGGAGQGSYGYYNMSGGSVNFSELDLGAGDVNYNGTGFGVMDMTGGTASFGQGSPTNNGWLIVNRDIGSGGIGILNLTGGSMTFTGPAGQFKNNWGSNGTAIINIGNATLTAANANIDLNESNNATNFGEINLLTSGTLQANSIASSANGTKLVNFNGGTLKASTATATFITTNNTAVNVFGNGGTIDNNGVAITIPVGLLAASGSGVSSIAVSNAGAGYKGAPAVTFTGGGGTGAAGYAVINSGTISQIVITNPGTGYISAPTIVFTGGGATTGAVATSGVALNTSGGMTFQGSGTTTLSGANTFTGGATINAGTLEFSATNAMPSSGTVTTGSGATLAVTIDGAGQFTTATSGAGSIGGLLGNVGGQGAPVSWSSGAALGLDTTAAGGTYAGVVSNPGGNVLGLTKLGSNTLTLTGVNTYTGNTTISAGTLTIGGAGQLGSGTYAGNISNAGTFIYNSTAAQTLSGAISGAGALTQSGAGTLTLSGSNTYSGATTLSSGTLILAANSGNTSGGVTSALSNSSSALSLGANTTLELLGNTTNTIFRPANSSGAASTSTGVVEPANTGPFNFFVGNNGSGTGNTLILANFGQLGYNGENGSTFNLSAANGYNLQIGSGTAGTGSLDDFNNTVINSNTPGSTLFIPGGITDNYTQNYSLTFGGAGNISVGSLSPDGSNGFTVTYGGTGTLSLTGTESAAALSSITANSGTVIISGSNGGTSGLTINGGAAVQLYYTGASGTNVIAAGNALTLGGGGSLSLFGNASGNTSQTLASLTVNSGGGVNTIALTPGASGTTTLTITSATITNSGTSSVNFNYVGGGAGTTNGSSVGNDYVVWNPTLTDGIIGGSYAVSDAGGTGFATVSGGDVLRLADPGNAGLPASGAVAGGTNYFINSNYGTTSTTAAGSLSLALTATESAYTVTVNSNGYASGALSLGTNELTIVSGGGFLFSGTNAYSITGSGGLTSGSGGTTYLDNYASAPVTISAPILNTASNVVIADGTGTTILAAANNTYAGATTVNSGTLDLTGTLSGGTAITVNGGTFLESSGALISGAASVTVPATGLVILGGSNTYTGATSVTGTLQFNAASAMSTASALTMNAGATVSLVSDSTSTFTPASFANSGSYTIAVNELTGAGAGKTLTLANTSNAVGNGNTLTVSSTSGDTLLLSSQLNMPGANATITLSGANMTLNAGVNFNGVANGPLLTVNANSNTLLINGNYTTGNNRWAGIALNNGTLTLANTQNGGGSTNYGLYVNLNGGVLNINNNAAIGGATAGNHLYIFGGILNNTSGAAVALSTYNPAVTINASFTYGTSGGTGTNSLNLGSGNVTLNTSPTITLLGSGTLNLAGAIQSTANGITEAGSGILNLSGANSAYSGVTTLNAGTLLLGNANALGTGALTINGGTLDSSVANLVNAGNNAQNWNGSFSFAGTQNLNLGTGAVTLGTTPTVTVTSGILTVGGAIGGAGQGITFAGPGNLVLAGSNTYTGATTVNAGKLTISGNNTNVTTTAVNGGILNVTGTTGAGPVNINGGGTLIGSGNVGGAVTVAGGATSPAQGTISLIDNTAVTVLTLSNGLTVGGSAGNSANLLFEVGTINSDLLNLGGSALTVNAGGANITVSSLGLVANSTYNLLDYGSGTGAGFLVGNGTTVDGLTLTDPALSFGVSGVLNVTGTAVQLVTSGATAPATAYWTGTAGGAIWTGTNSAGGNFTTDAAGVNPVQAYPAALTDVFFAATGATNLSNTLGQNFDIKGLTFLAMDGGSNPIGAVTISGSNILQIEGDGIVDSNTNGVTLGMTTLITGTTETWTNNSVAALTVNAAVTGAATGAPTLTVTNTSSGATNLNGVISDGAGGSLSLVVNSSGSGIVLLGTANTFTGGVTLTAGNLKLGNASALSTGTVTLNGGTLNLANFSPTITNLQGSGGAISGTATDSLTVNGGSYSGAINNGTGTVSLIKATAGTLVLGGTSNYSGGTTINAGTLSVGTVADSGTSNIGFAGTLTVNSGGTFQDTGAGSQTTGRTIILNGGSTINISSGNLTSTFVVHGNGSVATKAGAGTFAITSTSGDSDNALQMKVTGGTLVLDTTGGNGDQAVDTITDIASGATVQIGSNASAQQLWGGFGGTNLTINSGGTFDLNGASQTSITAIGGTNGTITNSNATAATLTTGNNNQGNTFYGVITNANAGGLSIIKLGTGYQGLYSTNTYSGTTTVNAGTLASDLGGNTGITGAITPFGTGNITVNAGTLELGANAGNHNYSTFSIANNVTVNGGSIYVNDAFQHLTGTITISSSGATMGSTYLDNGALDANGDAKGLFIDGPLTGSGNLTLETSFYDANHSYDGSVVYFTNAGTGAYNGTITVYNQNNAANGAGGYLFLVGNNALANATISLSGLTGSAGPTPGDNLSGARFGTSTLIFGSGNSANPASSAYTIGGLSGGAAFNLADTLVTQGGYSTGNAVSLTVGGNNVSTTYSGALGGAGGIVKTGSGTLTLSGSSTYTGGNTILSGTLKAGNAYALGAAGALAVNGGTLDLDGFNQTVGAVSGSAGGLITTSTTGLVSLTSNSSGNGTYGGLITDGAGQVALIKAGSGTLALTASNTYTGGTHVNGGDLNFAANTLSSGAITFGGGILQYASGNTQDVSGQIGASGSAIAIDTGANTVAFATGLGSGDTGGLAKYGSGILDLTVSNSYSGGTIINAGTLQIASDNNLGTGSVTMANGSTLEALNGITTSRAFSLAGNPTIQVDTSTYEIDGAVTDGASAGTLVKTGPGTLDLTASNSYSGGTVINAGTVQINSAYSLGAPSGNATINNGSTLEVLGGNTISTARNFSLSGTGTLQVDSASSYSLSGNVTDGASAGTLNKVGSGTLNIAGNASNSGGMNVNAGTVIVSGQLSGSGPVTINSGGTLGGASTGGFAGDNSGGTINGPVTVAQGGTLAPGAGQAFAGTVLTINNSVTMSGTSNLTINIDANNNADYLSIANNMTIGSADTLTLNLLNLPAAQQTFTYAIALYGQSGGSESGTFSNIVVTGFSSNATVDGINYNDSSYGGDVISVTLTVVPEPGTWAMLLSGLGFLTFWQRRRRSGVNFLNLTIVRDADGDRLGTGKS